MSASTFEAVRWVIAVAVTLLAVTLCSATAGALTTLLLAGAWCRKLDAEEHAVQLVIPEALNR